MSECILCSIIVMASKFLDRFQGKMRSIPKEGVEGLLKSSQNVQVYTNTDHSFRSYKQPESHRIRGSMEGPQHIMEPTNNQSRVGNVVQLPSIGERYQSPESRYTPSNISLKGRTGHFDRETNWLIEQPARSSSPLQTKNTVSTHVLQVVKQNLLRQLESKKSLSSFSRKTNCFSKPIKLGGLGPNIGGQDWSIRHQKQQKAQSYAKQIRKTRQKTKQNEYEPPFQNKPQDRFDLRDIYQN